MLWTSSCDTDSFGFGEEAEEEDSIGETADGEDEVVLPSYTISLGPPSGSRTLTNVVERLWRDLTNHEVGKPCRHRSQSRSLGPDGSVHDLYRATRQYRAGYISDKRRDFGKT